MKAWNRLKNGLLLLFILGCVVSAGCAGMGEGRNRAENGCTQANIAVRDYFSLINSTPPELVKLMIPPLLDAMGKTVRSQAFGVK